MFKHFLLKKALPATTAVVPVYLTVELINGNKSTLPLTSNILLNDAPSVKIEPIPLPAGGGSGSEAKIQMLSDSDSGSRGGATIKMPEIKGSKGKGGSGKGKGQQSTTPPPAPPSPPATSGDSAKTVTPSAPSSSSNKKSDDPNKELAELIKGMLAGKDRLTNGKDSLPVTFELITKLGKAKNLMVQINQAKAAGGGGTGNTSPSV